MALVALLESLGVRLCHRRSTCPNATHAIFIDKRDGGLGVPFVIWQLEPLSNVDLRHWLRCRHPHACVRDAAEVWEYSCDQLAAYRDAGVRRLVSVPLLPSRLWATRFGAPSSSSTRRAVDVMFVGAITRAHRRAFVGHVSDALVAVRRDAILVIDGKHVILEGEGLWRRMLETKILLNVHNFFPAVLEFARIMPALAAGVCVVSEEAAAAASSLDARLVAGVVRFVADAEAAVAVITALLADPAALERCSAAGIALSRRQTLSRWLREIGNNTA